MAFNKTLEILNLNTTKFSRKRMNENEEFFNENFTDVIQSITWKCTLTDEETGLSEDAVGTSHLQYPEGDFIPFGDITKSKILEWMTDHSDVEYKIDNYLRPRLENKIKGSQKSIQLQTLTFDSLPD